MDNTQALPNPADFSVNERPREYMVRVDVSGEILLTIEADSLEDAKAKAEEQLEAEDFGLELDEVHDASIGYAWKSKPMYRVLRDGKKTQTSWLQAGDLPREPDERGF